MTPQKPRPPEQRVQFWVRWRPPRRTATWRPPSFIPSRPRSTAVVPHSAAEDARGLRPRLADLLDKNVGSGRLTRHLCEAHELFALVELARDPRSTQGAARRCCRHPAAAHGSAALSRSPNRHLAWCASSVSFTSMRRHPTVVAWLFRLWNSCWDGLYRRWSVGTMRRLITRF
jgi:hypothetical protein